MDGNVPAGCAARAEDAPAEPGVHRRGRGSPRAWHRCQHGHLLRRQHGASRASAVSRPGSPRHADQHVAAGPGAGRVARQVQPLEAADRGAARHLGLPVQRRQPHRRQRPGAARLRRGDGGFLPGCSARRSSSGGRSRRKRSVRAAAASCCSATGFWRRRFGGDPRPCVGRTIAIDGAPHEVIGIVGRSTPRPSSRPTVRPTCGCRSRSIPTAEPGPLLRGGWAAQRRRDASRRPRRSSKCSAEEFRQAFPTALCPQCAFGVQPLRDIGRRQRALVALGADGRGGVRAAHRLRQRGEPAARARARRASARSPSARRSARAAGASCGSS